MLGKCSSWNSKHFTWVWVMTVLARPVELPSDLRRFAMGLILSGEFAEMPIWRIVNWTGAAKAAVSVLKKQRQSVSNIRKPALNFRLPYIICGTGFFVQTDRINHAPLIALLKRPIQDVQVKRALLDIEESFKQIRETRPSQVSADALLWADGSGTNGFVHLIQSLETDQLVTNWRKHIHTRLLPFSSDSRDDSTVPPFFIPVDEIQIPETLNLPVGPREQGIPGTNRTAFLRTENGVSQKTLLAKMRWQKNSAQAFAHCDYVRQEIDPQSAQL